MSATISSPTYFFASGAWKPAAGQKKGTTVMKKHNLDNRSRQLNPKDAEYSPTLRFGKTCTLPHVQKTGDGRLMLSTVCFLAFASVHGSAQAFSQVASNRCSQSAARSWAIIG